MLFRKKVLFLTLNSSVLTSVPDFARPFTPGYEKKTHSEVQSLYDSFDFKIKRQSLD